MTIPSKTTQEIIRKTLSNSREYDALLADFNFEELMTPQPEELEGTVKSTREGNRERIERLKERAFPNFK